MNLLWLVVVFVVVVLGGGLSIGALARPGEWYATLKKPSFNPPNWVFAPAWTLLYIMIAVAGARSVARGPDLGFWLWVAQLALNFVWSPVFFGLHRPRVALAIVAALLATILMFIAVNWGVDRASALLFVPYAAWVIFATLLNAAVVRLN
jgi:tryptophan-rich sensory protein